jgi:two-component system, OmpR family, heavy metal sensor histidine kinase CusS
LRTGATGLSMKFLPPKWPIAWRLTFLYALSSFFLLFIAAGVLDWILVSDIRKDNNEFLAAEMQNLRNLLKERPDDLQAWRDHVDREAVNSALGYARYYARIADGQGNTIVETQGMSTSINGSAFPRPTPARVKKLNAVVVRGADNQSFVVAAQSVTVYKPEARKRVIQLALDRSQDEETISDYRRTAGLVLLVGIIVSATLGFFIAKAGLRPLAKLAQVFMRVSPEHLNERVGSVEWPPEIADLGAAFDLMLQRLERSFELLSHFSADLAHELRTPINNLRGEAEVALGKARAAEEYRQVIESSLEEYERLSRVIDNLLFLARADTRNMVARLSPVNARQEIDAVMDYFDALAEEKAISFTVSGNALLRADAVLFRRAVTNVISNALHYTPEGGTVTVDVNKNDGFTTVSVSDTGIGIETACLEKLPGRFFRTDTARTMNSQGTGLGLAIVKSVMELHGGRLAITSTPDEGTTVRLQFPDA